VLIPLAEIASDWRDPVTGKTIRELLGELEK
jgi:2-amino-4-hydroxy-6-hydroxymethyldihydropteridine diphosphokinase